MSMIFNGYGVWAIYRFEMARALRTVWQSLVTPVITTALYFVVFGSAIGRSSGGWHSTWTPPLGHRGRRGV